MTRFPDDRQSGPDAVARNGTGPGVPSFLRPAPEDRPEPTDLDLHFHEAGPSYRTVQPRAEAPEATEPAAASAPAAPSAPVAPAAVPPAEPRYRTTPALAYKPVAPSTPKPEDYEIQPGSFLTAGEALRPSSEMSPEELEQAQAHGREWDPLTDPWPMGNPGSVESTLLERAARERVAPYGLMAYEPGGFSLPPVPKFIENPAPTYSPVAFSPAPYAEETEDPLLMTQPYEMELEHPSGPLPRHGQWPPAGPVPDSPAALHRRPAFTPPKPDAGAAYDVTLTGPLGTADLGFTGGHWYSLAGGEARPVSVGDAIWSHPELSGQIVQVTCWWMREHPKSERAIDLATELAMAVSDATRGNRTPLAF